VDEMIEVSSFKMQPFTGADFMRGQQGLLNEILALREIASSQNCTSVQIESLSSDSENSRTDYTMGIYQSIGEHDCPNMSTTYIQRLLQDTKNFTII
jgi:hypothetical protein